MKSFAIAFKITGAYVVLVVFINGQKTLKTIFIKKMIMPDKFYSTGIYPQKYKFISSLGIKNKERL